MMKFLIFSSWLLIFQKFAYVVVTNHYDLPTNHFPEPERAVDQLLTILQLLLAVTKAEPMSSDLSVIKNKNAVRIQSVLNIVM